MAKVFSRLWDQYLLLTPKAGEIHQLLRQRGENVVLNDHVAFRTLNDPRVSIDVLARPFVRMGYVEKGTYTFPVKKLYAKHFEHAEEDKAPKVFISELLMEEFSSDLQQTMRKCVDALPPSLLGTEELLTCGSHHWAPLHYAAYNRLLAESEYAAWLYVYGYCANHFTVNVNALSTFDSLQALNTFLQDKGFALNASGGLIKGTPAELLQQSSTLAEKKNVAFAEGTYEIPSCYYEFARRYPTASGELYSGFIAASADKIFESTDVRQQSG
ncbi:unnamed protein product [Vitrella brassicaformis CCMP3155]|uniref:2-oxoadipate dioxygenase/decarboxylase n=1 Tax=Vitrella brassicaformis (strain CCMP3155) TaxID=1169540 RepID=A0A0G4ES94_VITBC|nr:unnamed protein product [Vitrella brassicaformis CCMP3155]|eukprot:CEM01490.1 unnamed protein product [Vitrella brassicaformis CCMP3155]